MNSLEIVLAFTQSGALVVRDQVRDHDIATHFSYAIKNQRQ